MLLELGGTPEYRISGIDELACGLNIHCVTVDAVDASSSREVRLAI